MIKEWFQKLWKSNKSALKDAKESVAVPSLSDQVVTPEPPTDSPAIRRSRKIYESVAAKQRAYRERRKVAATAVEPIAPQNLEPTVMVQETAATNDPAVVVDPIVSDIPNKGVVTESMSELSILRRALSALMMPGPKAILSVQPVEPTVVPEPIATRGPKPVIPELAPMPAINWSDELRTDLPPRSPEHIARLLKFETEIQTQERISNDKARYRHARGVSVFRADQQSAISHVLESGGTATWVKR